MANDTGLRVGQAAPFFTLPDAAGGDFSLEGLRGKWVVLYFYPKDNTSGCTREAVEFTAALPAFEGQGAVVVGVSPDSAASHARFAEQHGLGVRLLSDPDHVALEAYGAWRLKKNYGREFMGVVRSTFLIAPDGTLAALWDKVKVNGHVDAVLARLAELQ
jgi:peroxiredoxin Q/BCP